ncbi:MAG: rod shape-determining protein MreC [Acidimicrobiia bacterium]
MLPFRRFERSTVLLVGLVMLSFLIATFDVRADGAGMGAMLRTGAQSLFAPVQQLATAVARPVAGFIDGVSNIAGLRDELAAARSENDALRQQLLDVQAMQNRLTELERILDLEPPTDVATVTARIASLAPSDFDQVRWIDRGSADGIAVGQAVIDEDGLVGRIDFVAENSARVRLITDPRSGVGVRDLGTNETGWIEGRGAGPLELKMFGTTKPVQQGERLVTDGTRFPPGIPVGVVAEPAEAVAGFALITTVTPSIQLAELDYVKVVVGWSPLDAVIDPDTGEVVDVPLSPVTVE